MIPFAAVALVMGAGLLVLMGVTATGERRRGHGVALAFVAGLFFPVTWAVWYLRDEHAYRATRRA